MGTPSGKTKVLLLEFNELTWSLIHRFIAQGKMPSMERLRQEGAWSAPMSNDLPPYLNPWVTWVTVHTGVEQRVHGANILEQPVDTISVKRSWEYAAEAGLSIGVFGSMGSFPPRPVRGFWVPGPFAPRPIPFPRNSGPSRISTARIRRHTIAPAAEIRRLTWRDKLTSLCGLACNPRL
jgi:predicted AlkP superfamily phosphohydrolase/phosphomutase